MTRAPALSVTPANALIDVPRAIVVHDVPAGALVRLATCTVRGAGTVWRASATFRAGADGRVDASRDAPLSGDYAGVSAMGLIWAQRPDPAGDGGADGGASAAAPPADVFAADAVARLVTTVTARLVDDADRADGAGCADVVDPDDRVGRDDGVGRTVGMDPMPAATATLTQRLMADGVTRRDVRDDGLTGTLFTPATPGPHPVVLILNGSGGGINEPRGALYASRGYQALALGYFKCEGRSDYISDTPLEYFETALGWIHRELAPRDGFVALSGQSRGGELVLLLGSMFASQVSAVIGYVPGAVVHCAQNACDPARGRDGAAWTYRGQPLPHLWQHNRTATWQPWDEGPEPRRHTDAILTGLRDADAVERARIRVERIRGPVLVLSGSDDGAWPSTIYGRMVLDQLREAAHPWPAEHRDWSGAGHAILFPYVPTTQLLHRHPVSKRLSTSGGSAAINARANEESWQAVRDFLAAATADRAHSGVSDDE